MNQQQHGCKSARHGCPPVARLYCGSNRGPTPGVTPRRRGALRPDGLAGNRRQSASSFGLRVDSPGLMGRCLPAAVMGSGRRGAKA